MLWLCPLVRVTPIAIDVTLHLQWKLLFPSSNFAVFFFISNLKVLMLPLFSFLNILRLLLPLYRKVEHFFIIPYELVWASIIWLNSVQVIDRVYWMVSHGSIMWYLHNVGLSYKKSTAEVFEVSGCQSVCYVRKPLFVRGKQITVHEFMFHVSPFLHGLWDAPYLGDKTDSDTWLVTQPSRFGF